MGVDILYRDDDVVAVNKPEGVAAVPERAGDSACLAWQVSQALGATVMPVHRLDKDVSGVILYARHAVAHRLLNAAFEQRLVAKRYLAVVHGVPAEPAGVVDRPVHAFGSGRMGVDARGRPSVTRYRVREAFGAFALLEVHPETGRRHQIRVHLYSLGHPIVGDRRYGDTAAQRVYPRLMLHADGIALRLPSGRNLDLHNCPSATFAAALATLSSYRCSRPFYSATAGSITNNSRK